MNILFLTFLYPNKFDNIIGIFIKEHAKSIKSAGLSIYIFAICLVKGRNIFKISEENFYDENDIPTSILYVQSFFYKFLYINPFFLYWTTRRFLKKKVFPSFKPNIIHSNMIYPAGIVGCFLSKKYNLDHVITEHWSKVDLFLRNNVFKNYGMEAFNTAKKITVVSGYLRNILINHNVNPAKIVIIPNTVSSAITFKPKKPQKEIINFCSIALWALPKRPDLIISALTRVSEMINKKVVYRIVGKGKLLDDIRTKQNNLPFILEFMGELDKNNIAKVLRETDYFLHASEMETFSVVIAEALMSGTPVVASNVGAIPELLNETNGILCDNTVEKWVEAILKAMQQDFNNLTISEMANKRYSQNANMENFKTFYEEL